MPRSAAASSSAGENPGEMKKLAPASAAASRSLGLRIVPAPVAISGTSAAMCRIASSAGGVRSVISAMWMPPANNARAIGTASSASAMRITGMTGAAASRERMAVIAQLRSILDR